MSASAMDPAPVVVARDLSVTFHREGRAYSAVNGVDLTLARGEVLSILGESGSGKSVSLRALMGILPPYAKISGDVEVAGRNLYALGPTERAKLRGPVISMIFQEPMSALDPVFTIGDQIVEVLRAHGAIDPSSARRRAIELLDMVAIPSAARRLQNYPHEMSGGMRQRAMIAMALACQPSVLLADEPTTALDVSVQIQILILLRQLQATLGMAVIFVTHDMGVAAEISDRIAVMYGGRLVETGSAEEVMSEMRHPYTRGLLSSTVHGGMRGKRLDMISGQPPDPADMPAGCAFAPRCTRCVEQCRAAPPPMIQLAPERTIRCLLTH